MRTETGPAAQEYTYRQHTVSIGGRRAFFREAAPAGKPLGNVILLHGWIGTSSWMFRHILPELGKRYRTIAPDLPGFGRSQTLAEVPSIGRYREFVRALADELEIGRFNLVGVSVGGTVALDLANRYPERVLRLAVQGPVYRAADLPARLRLLYDLVGRVPLLPELMPKAPVKWWFFVRRLDMGRDTRHLSPADRRQLGKDILRVPNETLLEVGRELMTLDMTPVARRICVPCLVIDGAEARMVPASASRRLGEIIPGAKTHIIPDAGHNVALERPQEFLQALLPFLGEGR